MMRKQHCFKNSTDAKMQTVGVGEEALFQQRERLEQALKCYALCHDSSHFPDSSTPPPPSFNPSLLMGLFLPTNPALF